MTQLEQEFTELRELTNNNKKLIKEKFKQFDKTLAKIKESLDRTEKLIKNFGE